MDGQNGCLSPIQEKEIIWLPLLVRESMNYGTDVQMS